MEPLRGILNQKGTDMDQRTAAIIMICKGKHDFGEELTHKQAIAAYLSDQCMCPFDYYKSDVIENVIKNALKDYIDSIPRPSVFIGQIEDVMERYNNPLAKCEKIDYCEAICRAFSLVQVRNGGAYINGFTEENTRRICKTNHGNGTDEKDQGGLSRLQAGDADAAEDHSVC